MASCGRKFPEAFSRLRQMPVLPQTKARSMETVVCTS